ncbi:tRNA modification GTPase [Tanacetum coccineum]
MMITYLKHMGKYTHQQLKHKNFEEVQKLYEREKWIDDFKPIDDDNLLWSLALKSIYEDGFESAITCINNEYHMNIEISAWSGKSCAVYTSHLGCLSAVVKWVIWCPLIYGYISKWVNWFCFDTIIQSWFSTLLMKGIRIEGKITGSHSFLSRMDLHRLISSLVQDWEAVKDTWMISWNFTSNFCDHEEGNSFASSVPLQITMFPNLEILWASSANIDGEFPRKWGDYNTLILNKDERVGSSSPSINQPVPDANSSSPIAEIVTSLGGQAIPTSHVVEYGIVCDPYGNVVDEVLTIPMLAPRSFIREDVVKLQCEITLRAFLNGRLDLSQAEDVGKLVSAKSVAAADAALAGIQA